MGIKYTSEMLQLATNANLAGMLVLMFQLLETRPQSSLASVDQNKEVPLGKLMTGGQSVVFSPPSLLLESIIGQFNSIQQLSKL